MSRWITIISWIKDSINSKFTPLLYSQHYYSLRLNTALSALLPALCSRKKWTVSSVNIQPQRFAPWKCHRASTSKQICCCSGTLCKHDLEGKCVSLEELEPCWANGSNQFKLILGWTSYYLNQSETFHEFVIIKYIVETSSFLKIQRLDSGSE